MRIECNVTTGETTELADYPVTPPTPAELTLRANALILAQLAEMEHEIVCKLCESNPAYMALKVQLK